MAIFAEVLSGLADSYSSLVANLSTNYQDIINVFIFSILIAIYSIFTWKFYRNLSKKDLLSLNLSQYNRTSHKGLKKFMATIFYLTEYIIILPFLIFFWFAVLALIIILLSEEQTGQQILIVSAAIVASIRMLAYYKEDLSRDLAKMFPFTVLVIFILTPSFFSVERVITRLSEVPPFFTNVLFFLFFIVAIEILLRIIDTLIHLFRSDEEQEIIEEKKIAKKIEESN